MTQLNQIYRSTVCGNIVEVLNPAAGQLVCCGKPMQLLEPNTTDAAGEKHVPVIEKSANGYRVTVGSVEHPMLEAHYIQWIELIGANKVLRHALKPGDKPEATFPLIDGPVSAREFCNLHGLWSSAELE